jgi:hypothetical protein
VTLALGLNLLRPIRVGRGGSAGTLSTCTGQRPEPREAMREWLTNKKNGDLWSGLFLVIFPVS